MNQLLASYPSLSTHLIVILLLFALVAFLLFFKQHVFCSKPPINIRLTHEENEFNEELISLIPQFRQSYTPPCSTRSRIVSTALFGLIGRFGSRQTNPVGVRERLLLPDGTTITFDLFLDPLSPDPLLENVILVLIPGVSNHSATDYARAYIEHASSQGFKVACLNHLGSNCGERLDPEVPRVHTYGGTGDFSKMIDFLRDQNPGVKFIGVGISLGGNVLLKYLGERPERQAHFLCAQSWCQGYDVQACIPHMNKLWTGAKLFNHLVSSKKKAEVTNILPILFGGPPARLKPKQNSLLHANESASSPSDDESKPMIATDSPRSGIGIAEPPSLFPPLAPRVETPLPSWVPTYAYQREGREVCPRDPSRDTNGYLIEGWEDVTPFDVNEFNRSTNIGALDNCLLTRLLGFRTREGFYRWCSSAHVMDQIKDFPVLLVNARDDPLIPYWVIEDIVSHHCGLNEKAVGILTKHGGHLGYYEGWCCSRRRLSWMDKVSIRHAKSVVQLKSDHGPSVNIP